MVCKLRRKEINFFQIYILYSKGFTTVFELLALLHVVQWSLPESARVRRTLADSTGLNQTVLRLPKVSVNQSPVRLSPVQLSLSLMDSGGLCQTLVNSISVSQILWEIISKTRFIRNLKLITNLSKSCD